MLRIRENELVIRLAPEHRTESRGEDVATTAKSGSAAAVRAAVVAITASYYRNRS